MTSHVKSLDDLSQGIKQLLSENRCSFSDEEKVLLNDCLGYLEQARKVSKQSGYPDFGLITKTVEILLRILAIADHLNDIF